MVNVASLNLTDPNVPYAGWVESGRDRGSIDILWSCCFTICLCCWVITHPNAGSPADKWYRGFLDRIHLFLIGLMAPELLFGIALGQLSSAMRSVRIFKRDNHLCKRIKWTYTYAFFTDMGAIHLTSPDFEKGFPISAEQLHYLVKHGHVDFPDMEEMNIGERKTTDTLSRVLTIWQVVWFCVTELQRIKNGLPMTTLELTALSYVFIMVATQICWLKKPFIMKPRTISTKDRRTMQEIRAYAKQETHPELSDNPDNWYCTPLTFINGNRFQWDTHWKFYIRLAHLIRMPLLSTEIRSGLWDRFPSDTWMPSEKSLIPVVSVVLMVFSGIFLAAWNFLFPTYVEQLLWRVSSVCHVCIITYGGIYYVVEVFKWHRERKPISEGSEAAAATKRQPTLSTAPVNSDPESAKKPQRRRRIRRLDGGVVAAFRQLKGFTASWHEDPTMALKLRVVIPITIACGLHILSRAYFYVEDFVSLRTQPVGVYITVNRFLPFLGDG